MSEALAKRIAAVERLRPNVVSAEVVKNGNKDCVVITYKNEKTITRCKEQERRSEMKYLAAVTRAGYIEATDKNVLRATVMKDDTKKGEYYIIVMYKDQSTRIVR